MKIGGVFRYFFALCLLDVGYLSYIKFYIQNIVCQLLDLL